MIWNLAMAGYWLRYEDMLSRRREAPYYSAFGSFVPFSWERGSKLLPLQDLLGSWLSPNLINEWKASTASPRCFLPSESPSCLLSSVSFDIHSINKAACVSASSWADRSLLTFLSMLWVGRICGRKETLYLCLVEIVLALWQTQN